MNDRAAIRELTDRRKRWHSMRKVMRAVVAEREAERGPRKKVYSWKTILSGMEVGETYVSNRRGAGSIRLFTKTTGKQFIESKRGRQWVIKRLC